MRESIPNAVKLALKPHGKATVHAPRTANSSDFHTYPLVAIVYDDELLHPFNLQKRKIMLGGKSWCIY